MRFVSFSFEISHMRLEIKKIHPTRPPFTAQPCAGPQAPHRPRHSDAAAACSRWTLSAANVDLGATSCYGCRAAKVRWVH